MWGFFVFFLGKTILNSPAVAVNYFPSHHSGHFLPGFFRSIHRSSQEDHILHYSFTTWGQCNAQCRWDDCVDVHFISRQNQAIYWGQNDDATLVIGKLLQTVVDNSGPQAKTYKTDRPLALQKKESNTHFILGSRVKEQPQITTPFSPLHSLSGISGGAIPAVYFLKPALGVFPLQPSGSDKRTRDCQWH